MSVNINEVLTELQSTVSGDILVVDAASRTIEVGNLILGVAGDENANRVYFLCPKVVSNGIDLTTLYIFVNYINANNVSSQYLVEDVQVVKEDYILFSWETTALVTAKKGKTKFQICAKKTINDEMNHWNTTYTSGRVLKGLETTDDLLGQNVDVVDQILRRLEGIEEGVAAVEEGIENVENDILDIEKELAGDNETEDSYNSDFALEVLVDSGVVSPMANNNNAIYTDNDGKIYIL